MKEVIFTAKYMIIHNNLREITNDELMHYGVKGMKWGVRRYLNEDGTLTKKGRARLMSGGYAGEDEDPFNHKRVRYGRNAYDYAMKWEEKYGYLPVNRLRFSVNYSDINSRGRDYVTEDYDWNRTSLDDIYESYREYRDSEDWD